MSRQATAQRTYRPSDGVRLCFVALMVVWMLFPVLIKDNLAQDAVPYIVAGELVRDDPGSIYADDARDLYDLDAVFAGRACAISPPGTDCDSFSVAFVSPPQALPFAFLVSRLGPGTAIMVMRLLGAACLVGGMVLLWDQLARRSPRAGPALLVTAVALTPFTMVPLPLGQTSPLLFLSACLGVRLTTSDRQWPAIAVAGLWVLTISFKLFPIALVAVLLWQHRFRVLAWAAGFGALLTAGALLLGPPSLMADFLTASDVLADRSVENPYNGSFDAVLQGIPGFDSDGGAMSLLSLLVRLVVVVGLAWWRIRRSDDDTQWAWAWLAVLVFVPLVWAHYLWLGVAAVGVALARGRAIDDRRVLALPLVALATIPISIPNATGGAVPVLQLAFLVVTLGLATWLAEPVVDANEAPRAVPDVVT